MSDLDVKRVPFMGTELVAAQGKDGQIWAGVSYICNGIGLNKNEKDRQVKNVQADRVLKKGCVKFDAGVFDPNNQTVAIKLDFVPLWLAKINITPAMQAETPELAERLEAYQLRAKDVLAEAFLGGKVAYTMPKDYPSALRALADAEEEKLALLAENEQQKQIIADFEPIKHYVDTILESPGAMATSQIAADYDMSARQLNKILHEEGIQHCVNGQWILYRKYMGQGYTKSKTFTFDRSDGRPDAKTQTYWTQKGRLKIHEVLTARGIVAIMDRKEVS